MQVWKTNKGWF
jgi:hypothetical protein